MEHSPERKQTDIYDENKKLWTSQKKMQKEVLVSQNIKVQNTSVKLPKLEIHSYIGDKLKWIEFWLPFETSVNSNSSLSNIDKFIYLRSKLDGEARSSIAGLAGSNENYVVAVKILKERYGNIQEKIDLHYNQLISLKTAGDSVDSLRQPLNSINRHLRCLDVLEQNIIQDVFVLVIKSKLPHSVLRHLEIQKGSKERWSVMKRCDLFSEYVMAVERAEKVKPSTMKPLVDKAEHNTHSVNSFTKKDTYFQNQPANRSAETLFSASKPSKAMGIVLQTQMYLQALIVSH